MWNSTQIRHVLPFLWISNKTYRSTCSEEAGTAAAAAAEVMRNAKKWASEAWVGETKLLIIIHKRDSRPNRRKKLYTNYYYCSEQKLPRIKIAFYLLSFQSLLSGTSLLHHLIIQILFPVGNDNNGFEALLCC